MRKAVALTTLLMLCLALSAQAATLPHVADQADTFTPEQEAVLQDRMEQIWNKYQFDTLIVTTRDSMGLTAKTYTIDFFEDFRENFRDYPDGITFSISFDIGEYFMLTRGSGIELFSSDDSTDLSAVVGPSFSGRDFFGAVMSLLNHVEDKLSEQHSAETAAFAPPDLVQPASGGPLAMALIPLILLLSLVFMSMGGAL